MPQLGGTKSLDYRVTGKSLQLITRVGQRVHRKVKWPNVIKLEGFFFKHFLTDKAFIIWWQVIRIIVI